MSQVRLERINRLILASVNELFLTKSKDPRLTGLTITRAVASGDLRTVRLFYSLIGNQDRLDQAALALEKANGFIRSHLAATLDRKHTPKLIFERDLNPENAQRVGQLLREIEITSPPQPAADSSEPGEQNAQGDSSGRGEPSDSAKGKGDPAADIG
ncbi:MAG: 30S ribosome-binding factor RbfA [Deltaproteobacteria bacterium]|jgi:ribosome-binding factor A|nr:30S ribosome-binding factor RbfA [Deltaproteobacteria bacterium]